MPPDSPSLPSPADPDPTGTGAGGPGRDGALDRRAVLAALRARVARIERSGLTEREPPPAISLCPGMDEALPGGGLARASLHEILSDSGGAATGFAALLLARSGGTVFWIAREVDAWPPGLMRFGLSPSQLVLAQPQTAADALWATEEALRCPAVSGVLLLWENPDATAVRRLQLAAETGGGIGLLLRETKDDAGSDSGPSLATTRWRVTGRAGGAPHNLGDPQWTLDLLRCRGGKPRRWNATWRMGTEELVLDDEAEGAEAPRRSRRH
ncbi:ImuA family protein [Muricoccus radiodurans]|uniref:ImuA family protein n=1 Tax=Muricoccus radiodurans TaxID=2231721 RepID=UPI003CF2D477